MISEDLERLNRLGLRFSTIIADPPWRFNNRRGEGPVGCERCNGSSRIPFLESTEAG